MKEFDLWENSISLDKELEIIKQNKKKLSDRIKIVLIICAVIYFNVSPVLANTCGRIGEGYLIKLNTQLGTANFSLYFQGKETKNSYYVNIIDGSGVEFTGATAIIRCKRFEVFLPVLVVQEPSLYQVDYDCYGTIKRSGYITGRCFASDNFDNNDVASFTAVPVGTLISTK